MKKVIVFLLCAAAAGTAAAGDYFNGGFEKCVASTSGIALPAGWISNRAVSRNGSARLTRETGCFRNGTFGLLIETEKKGCISFRALKTVAIKPGDTLEMEIYAKGTGRYTLQYILYGVEDAKHSRFLSTLGTGKARNASEEEWTKDARKVKFSVPARHKGKYDKFSILPVIYVHGDAEILFDDFKLKITPAK